MHLPDPPIQARQSSPRRLPVARLLLPLSPMDPREHGAIVELDRGLLQAVAEASEPLAQAGWALALNVDGPHVELVALKRCATVTAAITELARLGVTCGALYLDTPGQTATTHNVDLSEPTNVVRLDPPETHEDAALDRGLQARLGTLVLGHVPDGTDGERLLEALEHSSLGDVIGDVVAAINHDEQDGTGIEPGRSAPCGTGGDVTVELPDHEATQLPATEAAQLMVDAYGFGARDQPITGRRAAWRSYWDEVERLLAAREDT